MKIQWNKVTWYSWTLTAIIFLIFIPLLTFYFYGQYKEIAYTDVASTSTVPASTTNQDYRSYSYVVKNCTNGSVTDSLDGWQCMDVNEVAYSQLPPAIVVTSPSGKEIFHVGQQIPITWKTEVPKWPTITVMVVASTTADCSEYTTNGSMGTCRGYVIYTGSDTGSYDWIIPSGYSDTSSYLVRVFPGTAKDISTLSETLRALNHEGYTLGGYSDSFVIQSN